jgi:DHA1 family tetracycline resistance protein-like MFS transporter
VLPSTWSFYTMFKFGWSEAAIGASLAFAGVIMALGQGVLTRHMIPALGGERRAALAGMLGGAATYIGYAISTQGWMIYAWMLLWFLAAMVYPSLNALMSRQIAVSAQGELQGGVASMLSLSAILGPPLMTQLFSFFSSPAAPVVFPGAPYLAAALLVLAGVGIFLTATRPAAPLPPTN